MIGINISYGVNPLSFNICTWRYVATLLPYMAKYLHGNSSSVHPGCTYNHKHAATDPAAPAAAGPGPADEAAAATAHLPRRPAPRIRQISPGLLSRTSPCFGPSRPADQRATVFSPRLQHLPTLWVALSLKKRSYGLKQSMWLQGVVANWHNAWLMPVGANRHSRYDKLTLDEFVHSCSKACYWFRCNNITWDRRRGGSQ